MSRKRKKPFKDESYDDFHESLSPNYADEYRGLNNRDINLAALSSVARQLVPAIVVTILALLTMRFVTHLVSNDQANAFVGFFDAATDWLVKPFQGLLHSIPSGTGGFIDIPAAGTIIFVLTIAYLINRLLSNFRRQDIT